MLRLPPTWMRAPKPLWISAGAEHKLANRSRFVSAHGCVDGVLGSCSWGCVAATLARTEDD
eukprot:2344447-Amphidinium_carterae.1